MDRLTIEDRDRKKMKMKMQEGSKELKFENPIVKQCILASVESCDDWRPSVAAEAFALLERLTRNLIYNPERKLYHELKMYSGTFKHLLSRLSLYDEVLREIGYKRDGNSYRLHRFSDNLGSLMKDFMHASILCEIMHDLYGLESIDNRRLMCKIRLDPEYLEHQESERRVAVEKVHQAKPSPSGRVKFIEGDSYPSNSPKNNTKDSTLPGWTTDKQLSRPRPRSILRQPASASTAISIPVEVVDHRNNSDTVIPVEHYESQPSRVHKETKHGDIRVTSIPPTYSNHHRHSRGSHSVDFRLDDPHTSRTLSNSNRYGRVHSSQNMHERDVIMRSGTSRSEGNGHHRRRSDHDSVSARRDHVSNHRPSSLADNQRYSGLGSYRR